jgi:small-conductance mechanosensitive channel
VSIWDKFSAYAPSLVAAFIFVLFGLFIARVVSSVLEQFLRRIRLDSYTSSVGVNELLIRFGFGKSFSHMLSFIAYWALLLVFFVTAADILNLHVIAQILNSFALVFLPKMVAAIFIGFGGLLFARFMADVVLKAAAANNLKGGASLSKIVNFVIIVFTLIAAIEQLGIEMKMIRSGVNILFASMGLAFAIAVGLGAKDLAHDLIKGMFTENKDEK